MKTSTLLCSVLKHAETAKARTIVSPYFLTAPAVSFVLYNKTEHSVEASLFVS